MLKNKLLEIELYYQQIIGFYLKKNHRDLIIDTHHLSRVTSYKLQFIGVIKINFTSTIKGDGFNLDDKYISPKLNSTPDAFHWGIESFEISDWKIENKTEEITNLESEYNYKLQKIILKTTAFNLDIIFCELKINVIN